MAKFQGRDIEFKDNQKATFGTDDDSSIYWDGSDLNISTTVKGIDPTEDSHLVTKRYLDGELATVSGGIIQDHSSLTGLTEDDHLQYLLANGNRQLSGNWMAGNHSITAKEFYGNGATLSGIPYIDGDDVYFYDSTRNKTLSVSIIQISCGRNSANTTNQYLRTMDGVPMNQTGIPLLYNVTLVGASMAGARNDQSWTAHLRINGSATNLASLSINNAYENHTWSADVDLSEGDRVQVYMSGTNINYPQVTMYFRRRK